MSQNQLDVAYLNRIEITGADPPADAEPTPEQLAAVHARVFERGEAPYADFSVSKDGQTDEGSRLDAATRWEFQSLGHSRCDTGCLLESISCGTVHVKAPASDSWKFSPQGGDCCGAGGVLRAGGEIERRVPRDVGNFPCIPVDWCLCMQPEIQHTGTNMWCDLLRASWREVARR